MESARRGKPMSASRLKPATKRHNANISMAYGCDKDNNTYCYRRRPDGKTYLHRIVLGYGWENIPFDVTKLSCYEKGEDSMAGKTGYHKQWLPWDELMPKVKELQAQGYETSVIAQRLGIKKDTLWKRIALEKKRAQTPEPEGGQPSPAQSEAPALDIVPEKEITVKDVLLYELEQKEAQYTPTDNDYSDEPQRTTMTRAQYDAIAMNDDRMSALAIFCENQAVEQLRQDWAVDIFKHSRLSRERKLELIGQLLDWRAEA
jgi:hypothetical protein